MTALNTRPVRLAEILGVLALATDLGTGVPLEHAVRACLLSVELGRVVGLGTGERIDLYDLTLLRLSGCTADSTAAARFFHDEVSFGAETKHLDYGDPDAFGRWVRESFGIDQPPELRAGMLQTLASYTPEQRREVLAGHCEVAQMLAVRLGCNDRVVQSLGHVFERWDGNGAPEQAKGTDIPVEARIMHLCNEVEVHFGLGGKEAAVRMAHQRSGGAFDPELVEAFDANADRVLAAMDVPSAWEGLLSAEPGRPRTLTAREFQSAATVFADFSDMKSAYAGGHSNTLAALARAAGERIGVGVDDLQAVEVAALAHDLGRVTVTTAVWDRPGPLTEAEWERVRLTPHYTERVLGRSQSLAHAAILAGAIAERLDGSGYHRGSSGRAVTSSARLLAAAHAYQAMSEERAFRASLDPEHRATQLRADAEAGRLDVDAVAAVLTAAGHAQARIRHAWPAGLTDREVDVLRHICRGGSISTTAEELHLAPKTVDFHLQNIYSKAGVTTRAGATLFAIHNGILQDLEPATA